MLTKEECLEALNALDDLANFTFNINREGKYYKTIYQLIKEHFDPQPYTFRELNKEMWVWDDKENRADKIFETFEADFGVPYIKFDGAFEEMRTIVEFEVNRFFPVTKAKGE